MPVEGTFDFVVSTWLLSHLEHPEATVRAALQKLAPGGTAVFLFGTAPVSGVRAIWNAIWRAGSAHLVDPDLLRALPGFERTETFPAALGAMAGLTVYHGVPSRLAAAQCDLPHSRTRKRRRSCDTT